MNPAFQNYPSSARSPSGLIDLSHASLPSAMPQTAGKAGVQVSFEYRSVEIENVDPALNKKIVTRLCIRRRPFSERLTTSFDFISEEDAMRDYPREFALFQEYGEVPMEGTPLQDVPGLSRADVSRLNAMGLRSAEDVASLSEDMAIQSGGREMLRAWKVVTAWVRNTTDNKALIEMAERDAAMNTEMKAMRETMEAMAKQNEALQARIEAMQSVSGQYPPAAPQPGAQTMAGSPPAQSWNPTEDNLPYDLKDMPNPFADGSDMGDSSITDMNDDPLSDEPMPDRDGVVR